MLIALATGFLVQVVLVLLAIVLAFMILSHFGLPQNIRIVVCVIIVLLALLWLFPGALR